MSNLERDPDELTCDATPDAAAEGELEVLVLTPREVPLGGPRAMTVRRTLPQRRQSFVGGWCFVDHYGPDDVSETGGMVVPPHPHTGLQTVSWLFSGEIEHRDSVGSHAMVRPGELNLMTAGRGITHSEVSTAATRTLHGVQLWVALPEEHRLVEPGFEHHVPDPVAGDGWTARVFLGTLLGQRSPVSTWSSLLGAELVLEAGTSLSLDVDPDHEHGLLVDSGAVYLGRTALAPGDLGYSAPGTPTLTVRAEETCRLVLLGGTPLGETIVMWWNFVGRSHDDVAAYRANYQAAIGAEEGGDDPAQFALVVGDLDPLPAPALPNARLRPRS
ncbi:MAG: pirin family protein [Nocardioides sp.]|nr:pirin family protein [Nocardioides sp.]